MTHDFATAAASQLAIFGEALRVRYTPPGGEAVELTAIVGRETVEEVGEPERRIKRRRRRITISTDPESETGGVASPVLAGVLSIDEEPWQVDSIEAHSSELVVIVAGRPELMERSRPQYRGGRR